MDAAQAELPPMPQIIDDELQATPNLIVTNDTTWTVLIGYTTLKAHYTRIIPPNHDEVFAVPKEHSNFHIKSYGNIQGLVSSDVLTLGLMSPQMLTMPNQPMLNLVISLQTRLGSVRPFETVFFQRKDLSFPMPKTLELAFPIAYHALKPNMLLAGNVEPRHYLHLPKDASYAALESVYRLKKAYWTKIRDTDGVTATIKDLATNALSIIERAYAVLKQEHNIKRVEQKLADEKIALQKYLAEKRGLATSSDKE